MIVIPPSVRRIVNEVAEEAGCSAEQLLTRGGSHSVAHARWRAFDRIRRGVRIMGNAPSLPQIGGWFGVDHTTVLHGLRRVGDLPSFVQPTVRLQLAADMAEREGA